jgi:gamma-glutamyl:cysteine ligase YbdK (ATP-grasp superfamily)
VGTEIQQDRFTAADHARFKERLQQGLTALKMVLARPGFGRGERTMGAEVELFLVDAQARPLAVSQEVVQAAGNPLITPEMGSFDIELATPPVALAGRPFAALGRHIRGTMGEIRRRAAARGARVVPISVLPTFRRQDFRRRAITDLPRYRALAAGLARLRRAPFHICIDGEDPLDLMSDEPAMEGANTAFQVHLRVAADEFARMFNAALLLTAPALAAAGNSPTFLGHRLWHETRVALFKQAGDDRPPPERDTDWQRPPRISFGNGWVREGAGELFMESVAFYEPLLPVCGDEDAVTCAERGGVPALDELRLHHGTVWTWNRPVYDTADGGHLRIELRALPAGPTVDDMLANAAFLVGAILGLAPDAPELLPSLPFALAERNFYRAAQHGLAAELVWPKATGAAPESVLARDLVLALLPHAARGLAEAGVDRDETERLLGIIEGRVSCGVTGAVWQRRTLAALERGGASREEALRAMLERYIAEVDSGLPVHAWSILS